MSLRRKSNTIPNMIAVVQWFAVNRLQHAKTQVWPFMAQMSGEMIFSIHRCNGRKNKNTAYILLITGSTEKKIL